MAIFVVTDPEMGWDCVHGVYEAKSEEDVKKHLMKEQGYTEENLPGHWDDNNIIHETTLRKIN